MLCELVLVWNEKKKPQTCIKVVVNCAKSCSRPIFWYLLRFNTQDLMHITICMISSAYCVLYCVLWIYICCLTP